VRNQLVEQGLPDQAPQWQQPARGALAQAQVDADRLWAKQVGRADLRATERPHDALG
jgi:hypothetical protein